MTNNSDHMKKWYNDTADTINDRLEEFYEATYPGTRTEAISSGQLRVQPCPMCNHEDCCTVSATNGVKCFSGACDWKGTHIKAWQDFATSILKLTVTQANKELDRFTGLSFPSMSAEDEAIQEKNFRKQIILQKAERHYHDQMMSCTEKFEYKGKAYSPLEYMLHARKRAKSTVVNLSIGFTKNYEELFSNLTQEGFTEDEIKDANIWSFENLIIYFYRDYRSGEIKRFNTKNPFGTTKTNKDGSVSTIQGYSRGDKCMYYSPGFRLDRPFAVVEGENDLAAVIENGCNNVCATGGTIKADNNSIAKSQLSVLFGAKSTIYDVFDNDDAGKKYSVMLSEILPDKDIRKIDFGNEYNDIDEYYTDESINPKTWDQLCKEAKSVETTGYRIYKDNCNWVIAERHRKLVFENSGKNDKGLLFGTISYYVDNELKDKDIGAALMKCKASVKPLNFHLNDAIEKYYNSSLDKRSFDELINIYKLSSNKRTIINLLAKAVYESDDTEVLVNKLKLGLAGPNGSEDIIDTILKEVNSIQNKHNKADNMPKIKICQYFNVTNNDAYMYFTYMKADGDTYRKLPFLLRNDKELIRLDLLKRKDKQCMLSIDNKYELPLEVKEAVVDVSECSLTQKWVEEYLEGRIPKEQLSPGYLIREIEKAIKRFYYINDDNSYKVIALYIYSTYFYELFGQTPYLFLNGEKGSGKSVLDMVIYLYAFNAKMAIDISEAALFRMVSIEGGTIILDEMENLTSRSKTQDSPLASILKGGYCRSGLIYRHNNEKGITEGFNCYCPKVISNIFGLDDVIGDRCIQVNTYRAKISKDTKLEDPKYWQAERLDEVKELTSKCALSALESFQEVYKIYNNSLFETGNARLSQILTPIQAIANFVDKEEREKFGKEVGSYEKALTEFYEETLSSTKDNVEHDTPEGIIKKSIQQVALELLDKIPEDDKEYTIAENHKFNGEIRYSIDDGWFEVNVLHLKCFVEESMPGENVPTRFIPRWLKTVYKMKKGDSYRRTVLIENDDLMKEYRGTAKPKVTHYKFYFRDFVSLDDFIDGKPKDDISDYTKSEVELF
ncbi:MAG: toprim domain-containing protein [Anaerovoracaceae bacterium]